MNLHQMKIQKLQASLLLTIKMRVRMIILKFWRNENKKLKKNYFSIILNSMIIHIIYFSNSVYEIFEGNP